ncbi:SDR family oxidoreductase [Pseudomonas silvicola]|nr:SDR family oxidoreductase [Pseudomonas silvicola]
MDLQRHFKKVIIVTGAARGIGLAIARRLYNEGALLVLSDIQPEQLQALEEEFDGARCLLKVADVSRAADFSALVDAAVQHFGKLDGLINNAGVGSFGRVTELTEEQWSKVVGVDLNSVFFGAKAAIEHLARSGGSIVNVASISGLFGDYGFAAYAAAKGAVVNLTRNIAIDHGRDGVRCNSVCPGPIVTHESSLMLLPHVRAVHEQNIPLGRLGQPDEVASAVSFLVSTEASYINGHNLVIDGGLTAHSGAPNYSTLLGEQINAAIANRGG